MERKPYPSDGNDDEWAFAAPYWTLMTEDAPPREYELREVFNGLRGLIRTGASWRLMPHDLPPGHVVYEQTQRGLRAGVFTSMGHDLRPLLRLAEGRNPEPYAAIRDSRTLQSTPESGHRAGYDGPQSSGSGSSRRGALRSTSPARSLTPRASTARRCAEEMENGVRSAQRQQNCEICDPKSMR